MRSRDVFEVLGNPQYEKPLSEKLGKEYTKLVQDVLTDRGIKPSEMTEEANQR